ncbi:MAG: hybrid sensor histidine kinase/response regulator [Coleofasciculaceae cyanobacterium]
MSMLSSCLKEFAESIPVCQDSSSLATLLEMFRSLQCNAIVVVSQQQRPLGLVSLPKVMPYLFWATQPEVSSLPKTAEALNKPLSRLSPSLMETLEIVPHQLNLSQFLSVLQESGESESESLESNNSDTIPELSPTSTKENPNYLTQNWALVDCEGKFLGLLNSWLLLRAIAPNCQGGKVDKFDSITTKPAQLNSLVQILEQLPLPLGLQNSAGEMLARNLSWRQLLGNSVNQNLTSFSQNLTELKLSHPELGKTSEYQQKVEKSSISTTLVSPVLQSRLFASEERGLEEKKNRDCLPPLANDFSPELYLVLAQEKTQHQIFTQELLAKNAELVKLNRLKDEFLACISHELKTPITAILGLSSLLKDQALGALKDRQLRYTQLIYQNGRQLMTVVNDVLDLTRVETSQIELIPEPVQIKAVCHQAHSQALQRLHSKSQRLDESTAQTKFTLELDSDLEIIVADKLRLCQMLAHLLDNALQRTKDGGKVGLKVNRWQNWVAFTVWDTGDCISPDKQYSLFEQIPQTEEHPTSYLEGIDLGLTLTQRLAHLHGGDISFISKTNEGNQFTLLLPAYQNHAVSAARKRAEGETSNSQGISNSSSSLENRLILLVETVPNYLESLTEQFNNLGYRVVIARSAGEAIYKARLFEPSVILLNPLLAKRGSSWEIISFLKSDEQTSHIPVLVMATPAEKQQAEHSQADGFLSLPVQNPALLKSLARLGREQKDTSRTLTILHLNPEAVENNLNSSLLISQLTDIVNCQNSAVNYRVVEADDLEQAEILARIWNPEVVLLTCTPLTEPLTYLKHFSSHDALKALPLVTLDHQTTEAANQIKELSVYPCLAADKQQKIAAYLQVIKVAAGMSC